MSRIQGEQKLVPSVLDRLIDEEPEVERERARARATRCCAELKQAVRRDLENLLNMRRRCLGWPRELKELEKSLVNYGLPDFMGANVASEEGREQLCQALEAAIRAHESRFKSVKVQMLDNADSLDRNLRFRIDALLRAEPAPEPVVFDSALEPASGTIQVKGVS